jgi:hypothetical protein
MTADFFYACKSSGMASLEIVPVKSIENYAAENNNPQILLSVHKLIMGATICETILRS